MIPNLEPGTKASCTIAMEASENKTVKQIPETKTISMQPIAFTLSDISTNHNHHLQQILHHPRHVACPPHSGVIPMAKLPTKPNFNQAYQSTKLHQALSRLQPSQQGHHMYPSTFIHPSLRYDMDPHHDTEYGRLRAINEHGLFQKTGWNKYEPALDPSRASSKVPLISPIARHHQFVGGHQKHRSSSPKAKLSTIIKSAATKYRNLMRRACQPDVDSTHNTIKSEEATKCKREENSTDTPSIPFNEAMTQIFTAAQPLIREVLSPIWKTDKYEWQMNRDLHHAVGGLKGITEQICVLANESLHKLSDEEEDVDMSKYYRATLESFFEKEVLVGFCALLLRAPEETRNGLSEYLSDGAFSECFDVATALDGQLCRVMTATEKQMIDLRDEEERIVFESITCTLFNQCSEARQRGTHREVGENPTALKASRITEVSSKSPRFGTPFPFTSMYYQYPVKNQRKRQYKYGEGEEGLMEWGRHGTHQKKKRRVSSNRTRPDGTPRKKQENPCLRKLCRNPLQTDGMTKGCGEGTHPRTLCKCWLRLGYRKGDWKNGKIHQWLKEKYPDRDFPVKIKGAAAVVTKH